MQCTYHGYISTTYDALLIIECAHRGLMPRVTRRLSKDELSDVQSGQVFVFVEEESGIRRWTDDFCWSPSRVIGNFLHYRQMDRYQVDSLSFLPLDHPTSTEIIPHAEVMGLQSPLSNTSDSTFAATTSSHTARSVFGTPTFSTTAQADASLAGYHRNSYPLIEGGMCKKALTLKTDGATLHLVSYYTVNDILAGRLRIPSTVPEIASLTISPQFTQRDLFRIPPSIVGGRPFFNDESLIFDPYSMSYDGV